jgi:catechol 2,3-dioxygenase-like lactoylglutathione lyase family enzyme
MHSKFHHYGVTVSNMNESLEFYEDTLGLRIADEFSLDGVPFQRFVGVEDAAAEIRFLDAGTCAIELLEYATPQGGDANAGVTSNDIGASHICLEVDDVHDAFEEIVTEYDFISRPQTLENGATVVNVLDPDDNVVQLIEP